VRYTIHFGIPQSLEAFYQEAGRAGRDRGKAVCAVLFSDDNAADAEKALDPLLSADELANLQEPPWPSRGDVHRMVYFHKRAFRGPKEERYAIFRLLEDFIYRALDSVPTGEEIEVLIPFGDDRAKEVREKAIYRLSIVGAIEDYTLDYHARQFTVTATRLEDLDYIERLRSYVGRYKTREDTAKVADLVMARKGRNTLEKCLGFLVEFVYEEIERKRRTAIRQMADVARRCKTDKAFREELLAYLEKSPFTEPLLKIALSIEPNEWWRILGMVKDVDTARQLIGGARRTLESRPDHPGLLFLEALARLTLPSQEWAPILAEIDLAFRALERQVQGDYALEELVASQVIDIFQERFPDYLPAVFRTVLSRFPTRAMARRAYLFLPEEASAILLDLITERVRVLNNHLNEGRAHDENGRIASDRGRSGLSSS
jgi:ATP-dependent DNA helicase RecQ